MYFLFYFNLFLFTLATSSQDDLVETLSSTKWLCGNQNCSGILLLLLVGHLCYFLFIEKTFRYNDLPFSRILPFIYFVATFLSKPIALAHALSNYRGNHLATVDFNKNDKIFILGKPSNKASKLNEWWLVEAGSKKGLAPVRLVQEDQVIINFRNRVEAIFDFSTSSRNSQYEAESDERSITPSPSLAVDSTTVPSYWSGGDSVKEVIADVESGEETPKKPFKPPTNVNPTFEGNSEHFNKSLKIPMVEDTSGAGINNSIETNRTVPADNNTDKITSAAKNTNIYQTYYKTPQENDKNILHTGPTNTPADSSTNQTVIGDEASPETITSPTSTTQAPKTAENKQPVDDVTDFPKALMNHSNETINTVPTEKEKLDQTHYKTPQDNNKHTLPTSPTNTLLTDSNTDQTMIVDEESPESITTPISTTQAPKTEEGKLPVDDSTDFPRDTMNHLNETINTVPTEKKNVTDPNPILIEFKTQNNTIHITDENIILNDKISMANEGKIVNNLKPTASESETLMETKLTSNEKIPETVADPATVAVPETGSLLAMSEPSAENTFAKERAQAANPIPIAATGTAYGIQDNGALNDFISNPKEQTIKNDSSLELQNTLPNSVPPSDAVKKTSVVTPSPVESPLSINPSTLYNSQPFYYNYYNNDHNHHTYGAEKLVSAEVAMSENHTDKPNVSDSLGDDVLETNVESPQVQSELPALEKKEFGGESVKHLPDSDNIEGKKQDKISTTSLPFPYDDYYKGPVDNVAEEGGNWFSGFSSVMNSIKDMFAKSDVPVADQDSSTIATEETGLASGGSGASHSTPGTEMNCENDPYCFQFKDDVSIDDDDDRNRNISGALEGFFIPDMSLQTLACLIIISIVVLLFSLGHYYLENLKQDTALAAKINAVSTELFFTQKELATIEEKYQQANENYQRLLSENSNSGAEIEEMRRELEESQRKRKALEDEVKRMESEIESLVEEGDEMHRMLAESFNEEERTKSLLANISDLKGVLAERLQEIVSLTEQLDKERQEVELLTISLKKTDEKKEAMEEKLAKVLNEADSNTLMVTKEFEEKISTLERIIEERSLERTNFEKQICKLNGTCEALIVEKELAEKALKKAHGVSSGKGLSEWLEVKQIRTDFLAIQKEVDTLKKALDESKQQTAFLEVKDKELLNEIDTLNNKYESAEKDKIEALTKLQVLSNYFTEKEIQLQEELGTKEAQWLQKQSEDHTIYEQMRSLREENLSYKAQNEALKKEILDQETSFKIQIANEEQKAQENWINLRHTERRLKEVQMEASHLRSRLTALETNPDSLEDKHKGLDLVNGDASMGAASPPFMLYPPPDFIPPPPLVSPSRPPPLGRLSSPSPPLTPPAPLSPFEFYPAPPPSPPHRVHKPQPREPHRKQKDSQSSNHSSESAEKSVRRGKR